jgi:hypothetical protein
MTDDRTVAARQNVVMTGPSDARSWPARVVAFARSTEPRAELTARAAAQDALLAFAAAVASLVAASNDRGYLGRIAVLALLPAVLTTTLPLALRRIFPISVFWIILGGIVFERPYVNTVTFVAVVLAAYSAASTAASAAQRSSACSWRASWSRRHTRTPPRRCLAGSLLS